MSNTQKAPASRSIRKNKRVRGLYQERVDDSYKTKGKLPEPTLCPQCGAVYHKGRWQWLPKPNNAHSQMCPACHRIHDKCPAGFVEIGGKFFEEHRDEIVHLIEHQGEKKKAEHLLQRIMQIDEHDGGILVTTTDMHLARGIGEALHHAYRGELSFHYSEGENLVRVQWRR